MKSLKEAAEVRGHSFWGRGPDNTNSYNSTPHGTGFFRDGGDYDSYYGRFFLNWYSRVLIDHGDRVLAMANLAFEGNCIAAKVNKALLVGQVYHIFFLLMLIESFGLLFLEISSQVYIGGIKQLVMLLNSLLASTTPQTVMAMVL